MKLAFPRGKANYYPITQLKDNVLPGDWAANINTKVLQKTAFATEILYFRSVFALKDSWLHF